MYSSSHGIHGTYIMPVVVFGGQLSIRLSHKPYINLRCTFTNTISLLAVGETKKPWQLHAHEYSTSTQIVINGDSTVIALALSSDPLPPNTQDVATIWTIILAAVVKMAINERQFSGAFSERSILSSSSHAQYLSIAMFWLRMLVAVSTSISELHVYCGVSCWSRAMRVMTAGSHHHHHQQQQQQQYIASATYNNTMWTSGDVDAFMPIDDTKSI